MLLTPKLDEVFLNHLRCYFQGFSIYNHLGFDFRILFSIVCTSTGTLDHSYNAFTFQKYFFPSIRSSAVAFAMFHVQRLFFCLDIGHGDVPVIDRVRFEGFGNHFRGSKEVGVGNQEPQNGSIATCTGTSYLQPSYSVVRLKKDNGVLFIRAISILFLNPRGSQFLPI